MGLLTFGLRQTNAIPRVTAITRGRVYWIVQ